MTSPKKRAAILARKNLRRLERQQQNELTAGLRRQVFNRAGNRCEAQLRDSFAEEPRRCSRAASVFDHFFGRGRVAQQVSNCWALCSQCDDGKTHNRPGAEYWWRSFWTHATKYGYAFEASEVGRRMGGMFAVRNASAVVGPDDAH